MGGDRDEIHWEIVDEIYAKASEVSNDGEAIIAGGLGGASKSTVLSKYADVDQSRYLTIHPDDVKERLAGRQLVPEVEQASPMEASSLIHEESSHIAGLVAEKAYADRKNVIWE